MWQGWGVGSRAGQLQGNLDVVQGSPRGWLRGNLGVAGPRGRLRGNLGVTTWVWWLRGNLGVTTWVWWLRGNLGVTTWVWWLRGHTAVVPCGPPRRYFIGELKFGPDQLHAEFQAQRGRWVYGRG
jgi:hypothetical protein